MRILVPTDLSDFAAGALQWASMLAARLNAQLTVLYATEPQPPFASLAGPGAYFLEVSPGIRKRLDEELREHVTRHLGSGGADSVVVEKAPAQAILETAVSVDAELIVMGTHGRTGWRRTLLGSIAEKVIHHADRPVLAIPPDCRPTIEKILCPVNFTSTARVALERASAFAAAFAAELIVVHVADPADTPQTEAELETWVAPYIREGGRHQHIHVTGNAAQETIRLAQESAVDLIVLGSEHKRFADATIIGTTTERVVRFAKRPVLAVPMPHRTSA